MRSSPRAGAQIALDLTGATIPVPDREFAPPTAALLKWIGSKRRTAALIVRALPASSGTYWEPFLGSGAVLGTLRPGRAVASDVLAPLVGIWQAVQAEPETACAWYAERWQRMMAGDKKQAYRTLRDAYNAQPNPADLLFLARACYGGVIRFSQAGAMNTPCGAHRPIPPAEFAKRVADWHHRIRGVRFVHTDFEAMLDEARAGDLVYCDPPYVDNEQTLYGAQRFSLARLFAAIDRCKSRGVRVALSIDGSKRSGQHACVVDIPAGLFESEAMLDVGRSMLRRFQMGGQTLEAERVADRLLLT